MSFIIFPDEELILKSWEIGQALKQKNEHHSDIGFNEPSHPFALERIFHSHKCRTSKATSGSMKLVGNFENFLSPAIMGGSQPKRITSSCAFQIQALCLSLSDKRIMSNPAAAPGSYSLGSTGRTDSCSLSVSAQTARAPRPVPKSSTELVPTQRSTVQ